MRTLEIPEGWKFKRINRRTNEIELERDFSYGESTLEEALSEKGLTIEEIDSRFRNVENRFKSEYLLEIICDYVNDEELIDLEGERYYPCFKINENGSLIYDCATSWTSRLISNPRISFNSPNKAEIIVSNFFNLFEDILSLEEIEGNSRNRPTRRRLETQN